MNDIQLIEALKKIDGAWAEPRQILSKSTAWEQMKEVAIRANEEGFPSYAEYLEAYKITMDEAINEL